MPVIDAALVAACSFCDRLRGGMFKIPHCGTIFALVYGAVLGWLLDLPPEICAAVGLLWLAGERVGWGYPMGQAVLGTDAHAIEHPQVKPEKWQFGPLMNPWLALVFRGALWAVPSLALSYWYPQVFVLLFMALAMPAGALLDRTLTQKWVGGEWLRGAIMGAVCAIA